MTLTCDEMSTEKDAKPREENPAISPSSVLLGAGVESAPGSNPISPSTEIAVSERAK